MIQANVIYKLQEQILHLESFEDTDHYRPNIGNMEEFFAISTSINEYNNEFLVTWGDENGIIHGAIVDIDDTDIIY